MLVIVGIANMMHLDCVCLFIEPLSRYFNRTLKHCYFMHLKFEVSFGVAFNLNYINVLYFDMKYYYSTLFTLLSFVMSPFSKGYFSYP